MKVTLIDVTVTHLPILHRWLNSEESLGEYDETSFPTSEQLEKKFKSGGYKTTWVIEVEGKPVGYSNFTKHPWDDWIACIGVVIAEPTYRGKGIGTIVHGLLAEKIFSQFPDIYKLEAFTDIENGAEKRALEKASFFLEGTQKRKNKLRGHFRDMHVFGYLRPD